MRSICMSGIFVEKIQEILNIIKFLIDQGFDCFRKSAYLVFWVDYLDVNGYIRVVMANGKCMQYSFFQSKENIPNKEKN